MGCGTCCAAVVAILAVLFGASLQAGVLESLGTRDYAKFVGSCALGIQRGCDAGLIKAFVVDFLIPEAEGPKTSTAE